jgi:hypothetical protein
MPDVKVEVTVERNHRDRAHERGEPEQRGYGPQCPGASLATGDPSNVLTIGPQRQDV